MIHSRNEGKELYYLEPDGKIMAAEVNAAGSDFHAGTPKALFSVPDVFVRRSSTPLADVRPDGKRFLFAMPVQQNQPDDFK